MDKVENVETPKQAIKLMKVASTKKIKNLFYVYYRGHQEGLSGFEEKLKDLARSNFNIYIIAVFDCCQPFEFLPENVLKKEEKNHGNIMFFTANSQCGEISEVSAIMARFIKSKISNGLFKISAEKSKA
jgi:hypothetical protein